jgi:triacylglycerol esterase/lipase EstA (alpha/beta hydrolase family)
LHSEKTSGTLLPGVTEKRRGQTGQEKRMLYVRTRRTALVAAVAMAISIGSVTTADASYDTTPAGANNFSCHPTAAHPQPVVLLSGLGGDSAAWFALAPKLISSGYCVFTLNYGEHPLLKALFPWPIEGVIPMEQSAPQLAAFVDRVLAATHAEKVDIVGHSEGTVMPRYYLERLGGAAKVKRFISLTPLWRGSNVLGIATLRDALAPLGVSQLLVNLAASLCGACTEVLKGSPFLNSLNADGEAVPGVEHTNIVTTHDEAVVPYTSGLMQGPGTYTNLVLQNFCPNDWSEHVAVAFDPPVLTLIANALDPAHEVAVKCS